LAAVSATLAAAQDRSQMDAPAFAVFERMLRMAGAGEREKIERSLQVLAPVLAEHERAFGAGSGNLIADALRNADTASIERAVQALVARDVVVLLRRLTGATRDQARTWARTAVLEWRLIESVPRDLRAAQAISKGLRDVSEAVEAGDLGEARSEAARVEKELLQLFRQ
jgi:hypothetical protein